MEKDLKLQEIDRLERYCKEQEERLAQLELALTLLADCIPDKTDDYCIEWAMSKAEAELNGQGKGEKNET